MTLLVTDTSRPFRSKDDPGPQDWFDVLEAVACKLGTERIEKMTVGALVNSRVPRTVLAWNPQMLTVLARLLGHRVVYLCWGLPSHSNSLTYWLKLARLRGVLATSSAVLVNDPVTAADVARMSGQRTSLVPYVVDGEYFRPIPNAGRSDFLLVPGSNDRDEELVKAIALATGRRVVRVTQSRAVVDAHAGTPVEVLFNIPYPALACLYREAGCVLLPIRTSNHTAGQTAVLEAVASEAPVIVSAGRTSALADQFESVIIPPSNDMSHWLDALRRADSMRRDEPELLARSAATVRERHSPAAVATALLRTLAEQPQ